MGRNILDDICQPSNIPIHIDYMAAGTRVVAGQGWKEQFPEDGNMGEGTVTRNQCGYLDVKFDNKDKEWYIGSAKSMGSMKIALRQAVEDRVWARRQSITMEEVLRQDGI